jgi:hypothetical protein
MQPIVPAALERKRSGKPPRPLADDSEHVAAARGQQCHLAGMQHTRAVVVDDKPDRTAFQQVEGSGHRSLFERATDGAAPHQPLLPVAPRARRLDVTVTDPLAERVAPMPEYRHRHQRVDAVLERAGSGAR